ncbi:hypothetical protein N7495_000737 [Penicillium taxi]|uniref:uncharacterized protein n=1 Tax=Penicillium taxi TaxID=168475 RepID=UPI002544F1E3|nr:uncharacterized protein N7495_000737 [Penicillium taxi]KAJ5908055.1 hypothetical protein N7495_000737 [Penicillium taxi]
MALASNDKRVTHTSPQISGFTGQKKTQIEDAFSDAIEMAKNVLTAPTIAFESIFDKYFPPDDKATVLSVFETITGGSATGYAGNSRLSDMTIIQDYRHADGYTSCTGDQVFAELLDNESSSPKLVLCNPAFLFGGIEKGYTGVDAVTCNNVGRKVSEYMDTLGSTLLHEYTHFAKLVVPPLFFPTVDLPNGYGAWNAQNSISNSDAISNADNYNWFATELFWTVHCTRWFEAPDEPTECLW